jgi:hypothetical protein
LLERQPKSDMPRTYRVYLLRLWRADLAWRASLEEPGSGRRHGFADLDSLLAFLEDQVNEHMTLLSHDAQGE